MKKYFAVLIILLLVALLAVGCKEIPSLTPVPSPTPTPQPSPMPALTPSPTPAPATGAENFRLLISDEVNAIDHFASLNVTISSIGVHQAGDSGTWHIFDLDPPADVDLRPLEGENALEIWSGNLSAGEYNKVFIYVDNVTGILDGADGDEADVKLPSNKLQISKPFTIGDSVVNFVYDITVVQAGKSGKYILKPQIAQSGAEQEFHVRTLEGQPGEPEEPEETGDSEGELELRLEGELGLGAEVILSVMDDGTPVEDASVTINGEEAGSTDADGQLVIMLPETPGEVEIEATLGDKSGEIELDLEEQEEAVLQWFEGNIIALEEGEENASPWLMTLEGVEGQVEVYVTEVEGTPTVGAHAEVEGVLIDNIIENARAVIEEEEEEEGEENEEEENEEEED